MVRVMLHCIAYTAHSFHMTCRTCLFSTAGFLFRVCTGRSCSTLAGGVGIPDADFAVFVSAYPTPACLPTTGAHAVTCSRDELEWYGLPQRPLVGYINFCPPAVGEQSADDVKYVDGLVDTATHELIHTLFMSANLYEHYIKADGTPLGCGLISACMRPQNPSTQGRAIALQVVDQWRGVQSDHIGCGVDAGSAAGHAGPLQLSHCRGGPVGAGWWRRHQWLALGVYHLPERDHDRGQRCSGATSAFAHHSRACAGFGLVCAQLGRTGIPAPWPLSWV